MNTLFGDFDEAPRPKDWHAQFRHYEAQQLQKVQKYKSEFASLSLHRISDERVRNTRHVYENHLIHKKTTASLMESIYFCILSQNTAWEIPSRFVRNMRKLSYPSSPDADSRVASLDVLTNYAAVERTIAGAAHHWAMDNRCQPFLDYYHLNPDQIAADFKQIGTSDPLARADFCNRVKYFEFKTYSFVDLMHGGTGFITLDVHVMRGLYRMGVAMSEWFFVKKPTPPNENTAKRGRLRAVTCRPTRREYVALEQRAMQIFAKDERFHLPDGRVNGGLATTLLWWMGAGRRDETFDMFGYHASQELPYGKKLRIDGKKIP